MLANVGKQKIDLQYTVWSMIELRNEERKEKDK